MKLSIEEFYQQVADRLRKYLPGGNLEVTEKSIVRLKVRYHIALSVFIDIFYAVRTEKVSFTVIQQGERIFGIDNLGGWHYHPFGKPENHVPINEPSINEIAGQCTIVIKGLDERFSEHSHN